jgi:hypothetical protein
MTLDSPQDTPFPLGRLINHDPRSRNFPAPRKAARRPVLHTRYGKVLDQGSLGSCTGNAMAQALNMKPLRKVGSRLLTQTDAVGIYSAATAIDPWEGTWPSEDTGSDGLSVCKVAKTLGYITGYSHAFGLQHALDALQLAPVLVGVPWFEEMFYPRADGFVKPMGYVSGGHEIVLFGDDNKGKLTFLNSWGSGWGKFGRFHMSYDDFGYLLSQHGDVAVPVRAAL